MNIRFDPARLDRCRRRRGAGRRHGVSAGGGRGVGRSLLASWRGAAALRFGELWPEWREGADGVIAGLGARADSLGAARDD